MSSNDAEPIAVREGRELLEQYWFPDDENRYGRAEEFRENVIRLIVFDMHLAIEDLLKWSLHRRLSEASVLNAESDVAYVKDLRSGDTVDLAARLGVIDAELHRHLVELNSLRNRAGHIWALDEPELSSKGAPKAHPLRWKGGRLTPKRVRDDFLPLYSGIYLRFFLARTEALDDEEASTDDAS